MIDYKITHIIDDGATTEVECRTYLNDGGNPLTRSSVLGTDTYTYASGLTKTQIETNCNDELLAYAYQGAPISAQVNDSTTYLLNENGTILLSESDEKLIQE